LGTDVRRRQLLQSSLAVAGLSLLSGCGLVSSPGQQLAAPRRIGFLESGGNSGGNTSTLTPFRDGLRGLGYVEGENIQIEYRDADVMPDRIPTLVAELVGMPVEIIVVANAPTAAVASRATSTIPIVAAGGNVVAAGLVSNVARPEGNMTGVTTNSVEAIGKWIELLKQTVPTISHLAVLADLSSPAGQPFLTAVERAARSLQLQQASYDVRDLALLAEVLATAQTDGADGVVFVSGGVFRGSNDPRIGGAGLQARLPSVAESRAFAVNGGLLAHGPDTDALARRSAVYVDKILKGAKPGDLPIELPTKFNVVVNLKTAQVLGITVPQSVLQQATEIIQ
jgi:putative ABC transport system substrate-binding protein